MNCNGTYLSAFLAAFFLALASAAAAPSYSPVEVGTSVNGFQDDFEGVTLGANWSVAGASVYTVGEGRLHIGFPVGDPNHLLYTAPGYQGTVHEVLARIRVTRFGSGSYARGGVAVAVDAPSSQGINLTFRDDDAAGHPFRHASLLNDYRAWGPVQAVPWLTNTWYWLRLRHEPNAAGQGGLNDVFARLWLADGSEPEPAGWTLTWNYTPSSTTRSGFAGFLAGSRSGGSTDFSEFDVDYVLIKAAGLPSIVVAPSAFLQIAAAITNGPQDQLVAERGTATFNVGVLGSPTPVFQWYRDNVAIPAATNTTYALGDVRLTDDGARFHVTAANVVSNVTITATSSVARLTVLADTNAPVLLGARSLGLGLVQAWFSERLTVASAANPAHFSLTGPQGAVTLQGAALDAGTNVLLTVSALTENATYALTVNGVRDESASGNLLTNGMVTFVALQPPVVITEFVADNSGGLTDADGDRSDWIEIQNQSGITVELSGWRLTDNPSNLALWVFPQKSLTPSAFAVVFASGKDRRTGAELHANFKLDAGGEYLALVRPDGTIASHYRFGNQRENVSFGLVGNTNLFMTLPTPGSPNGPGVAGFVADTKVTPNRGFFSNAFSLSITCATANAEIWYSLDGTVPAPGGAGSLRYLAPLNVANTTTLRAAAFLTGYAASDVDTHTFIFLGSTARQPSNPAGFPSSWNGYAADYEMDLAIVANPLPGYDITNALLSLPAISLVAPRSELFGAEGIYARSDQQGDAWEREASIELIYPDGTPGFQYEAGLRVHGYTSRFHSTTLKHSLTVSFRDRFGPATLPYALLPDAGVNEYDVLVLRACSTDSYPVGDGLPRWEARRATYIRDQWMRDAMRDMGQITSHGRYVHLWLNGLYWGLYNVCEGLGSGFAATHLGGSKDEYDVIKDYFLVDDGNRVVWDEAAVLAGQGFSTEAAYQRLQGNNPDGTRNAYLPVYLNVTNYADYVMVHILSGANDWPMNNWWSCRRRGTNSAGFHFCVWDQEISNESLTTTVNVFCQPFAEASEASCLSTPGDYHGAFFYDALRRTSPSFRQLFMDRAWRAHTGNGALTPAQNAARWLARQNEIDRAIVAETARWGDARREPPFTRQGNWLPEMQWVANYWAANHTRAIQRYRSAGLWPLLGPPAMGSTNGYFTNSLTLSLTHTNPTGSIWFTLDGSDPRSGSGTPSASARLYAGPHLLSSSTRVLARVTDGANWSPPAEGTFLHAQAVTNLVITEIHYNPPGTATVDGEAFEFVELQNRGLFTLDLGGLVFSSGITFAFTNGTTLAPGAFWVLARDATNFATRHPGVPVHGLYTGKLDNNGEVLVLSTVLADTVLVLRYDNAAPWPAEADNSGLSLQRFSFALEATNAAGWLAAPPTPGAGFAVAWLDSDADGLPDGWEEIYGFTPGLNDADGDADGDGLTNREEFEVGTNPRSSGDVLRLEPISAGRVGLDLQVVLGFQARSNKTYTVTHSEALLSTNSAPLINVTAAPTNRYVMVSDVVPAGGSPRFYRLASPKLP